MKNTLLAPKLNNNPSFDVILTETTPLLSFFNTPGKAARRSYEIELDSDKNFNSQELIKFKIKENGPLVSDFKIKKDNPLKDKQQYYWRVRTINNQGNQSDWVVSRFFIDTESDDQFMNLVRAKIKNIEVSDGFNKKNIIDYDDPGLLTFWQGLPPGTKHHFIKFDLGEAAEISRLWILSNPDDADGWLKNFVLESSDNGETWQEVPETEIKNNDTFRNIIDFEPRQARFFRLKIMAFVGYAAQINEIILYSPARAKSPWVPDKDYVLIIGNEHNGFTFTDLAKFIEKIEPNLKTITVPYFESSSKMLESLPKKPKAIILSGNNADYPNLPMFEHNGEFEIIRNTKIPILGICAGHQFLAMAYGYSRARSMGWSDISAMETEAKRAKIKIIKDDPIFEGMENNFTAPEIHGWTVVEPADEFEVIAKSTYIQVQKSTRRLIYGTQFHAEIDASYNQAVPFIKNFLKLAKDFTS